MKTGWETKLLGNLFQVCSSKRVLQSQWKNEGVPFYRGREITRLSVDGFVDNELFISGEHYLELATKYGVPSEGDIVITAIGTIGNSHIVRVNDKFYFKDASILWLKKTVDVSSEFINFWLKSPLFFNQLDRGNGATVDTLTINKLKGVQLNLPALAEQQRIVAILNEAFEGIATAAANAEKNLNNARELFESTLQSVFANKGEGWIEKNLEDLCNIKHGFAFDGNDFGTSSDTGKPIVITPGNFTEYGTLSFTDKNTKRFFWRSLPADFIFNRGDLVVVMTDLSSKMKILGRPALIEQDGVLHNQRIGRLLFNDNSLVVKFLYYFFMTRNYLDNIKRSATGTMVKHTAPKRILSNKFPFPIDLAEQQIIVSKLDELSVETKKLEALYQQKLVALDELKKSILNQAFSGQLHIKALA